MNWQLLKLRLLKSTIESLIGSIHPLLFVFSIEFVWDVVAGAVVHLCPVGATAFSVQIVEPQFYRGGSNIVSQIGQNWCPVLCKKRTIPPTRAELLLISFGVLPIDRCLPTSHHHHRLQLLINPLILPMAQRPDSRATLSFSLIPS